MHATTKAVKKDKEIINFRLTVWKEFAIFKQSQTLDLLQLIVKVQSDKNIDYLQLDKDTLQHITALELRKNNGY